MTTAWTRSACTGIGGIVGALLTGVFSYGPLSATDGSPDGIRRAASLSLELQAIGVCCDTGL